MACDLALYLLKQGSYSKEGDIVILVRVMTSTSAELTKNDVSAHIWGGSNTGTSRAVLIYHHRQLLKVREALRGRVMVLLDERDQREIDKRGDDMEDEPAELKSVEVGRHVCLISPISSLLLIV